MVFLCNRWWTWALQNKYFWHRDIGQKLHYQCNSHAWWNVWFVNKRGTSPWQPLVITGFTTVYPKKYAHGFCFAVLCCGYTLTDFPISIKLTSLALWQSNNCPSASKATLMNMDKYFMWIHYERLHNHNKAKHNKTVCIFLMDILYTGVLYRSQVPATMTGYQ